MGYHADDAMIELGINNRYVTEMYKIFPERMPPIPIDPLETPNDN